MPDPDPIPLSYSRIEPRVDAAGLSPAVIVLHGRGADAGDLLPIAQRFPDPVDVISLQAPDPLMGGYNWFEFVEPEGSAHSQPDPDGFRRSLDLIDDAVAAAVDGFGLDPDRLGVFGFSQGAMLTFASLVESPDRYAWGIGSHGSLPDSHRELDSPGIEGLPVFVSGGRRDPLIEPSRVEATADRFRAIGCTVTEHLYDGGHGVGPDELTDLVAWVGDRVGTE